MKLSDLKNIDIKSIDLKSIDTRAIMEQLSQKRDLVGQVVVVALSLFIVFNMVSDHLRRQSSYQQDVAQLHAKVEVIKAFEDANQKLKDFMAAVPPALDDESFAAQVTDLATANHVAITAFNPQEPRSERLTEVQSAQLGLKARRYQDLVGFIKALEEAPYALRIDSCMVTVPGQAAAEEASKASGGLTVQLEVASVRMKK